MANEIKENSESDTSQAAAPDASAALYADSGAGGLQMAKQVPDQPGLFVVCEDGVGCIPFYTKPEKTPNNPAEFLNDNFMGFDRDRNKYVSKSEITEVAKHFEKDSEPHKLMDKLISNTDKIVNLSNDKWGSEDIGISEKDLAVIMPLVLSDLSKSQKAGLSDLERDIVDSLQMPVKPEVVAPKKN